MAQPVDDLDLGLPDNRLCEGVALAVADRGFDPGCGRALAWRIDTYRRQVLSPVVNPATQILRDVSYQSSPGFISRGPFAPGPNRTGFGVGTSSEPGKAAPVFSPYSVPTDFTPARRSDPCKGSAPRP